MTTPFRHSACALAVLASLAAVDASAQQQVVRPPVAQYWMDVATHAMPGMPEMPGMGALGADTPPPAERPPAARRARARTD